VKFSHFFIDRPIFAVVVSVLIVLTGSLAYFELPVAQFPDVAPPTVVVRASYPGASPETIARTVATPLEQEINGVENMLYMESQSTTDGAMTLTITFALGTDLDLAQVLVQNRVAVAEPRLPEDVRRIGVTTTKSSPDLLMVVHMVSPRKTRDQLYISNYVFLRVRDELSRLDGVGDVQVLGARQYSMRVWLDIDRMASLELTSDDVLAALREQNVQVAAGAVGQPPTASPGAFQVMVASEERLREPDEFGEIVIKSSPDGRLVRLRDVARIELGAQDYAVNSYLDGNGAVAMIIFQRPGSNAVATAQSILDKMDELAGDFPPDLEHRVVYNPTRFVEESIAEVFRTLFEAAALVALTVFVFLQSWRSTIIPVLAIPVSLIGTFAVMQVIGFSLNSLSLLGLVLAIGIVVDDAIVVVENVERLIAEGHGPRDASRKAMDSVGSALVATMLVLIAVFVPTAFLGGVSGEFYRQFAITIAVSTAFSALVSLTLTPALCAILLQHGGKREGFGAKLGRIAFGWFFKLFNRAFETSSRFYAGLVRRLLRASAVVLVAFLGLVGLTAYGFQVVPTGFVPAQDQGYLIVSAQLPDGASLSRTDAVTRRITEIVLETPGARNAVGFAGFSGATRVNAPNSAAVFAGLEDARDRSKRGLEADVVLADLRRRLGEIEDAMVFAIPPPPVRGIGSGGGFRMQVQDRAGLGMRELESVTGAIVAAANAAPEPAQVFSTFRAGSPQLFVDIDREKASMLHVPIGAVFATLQAYLGSVYANDFDYLGRVYRVTAQAAAEFRDEAADIARLRTRSSTGAVVPIGSLARIEHRAAPDRVVRFNLYPAADVNGDTTRGFSSGQTLEAMERIASETLPPGMTFEWTDLAYQEKAAANTALFIFPLCVLLVFLALAAQYESWILPLAVILIVPLCLLFALGGVWLRGLDNDILVQIGFVVLVGLACKNAILIVEFAKALEEQGRSRHEAAIEACRLRLRPILMTSFAFILGVVPLVVASGAGAEMRRALGTAVFSGMIGVTGVGLLLTPVFYVVLRGLAARRETRENRENRENRGEAR
jgi:hydrophobe/amphiphile efflux-1 (HAE1) family protein